ncbi:MAG: DoxX family protein, partial [Planctomycetales bacterium]|nr:DoxX family protein [Planctomycetales bacterium]
MVDSAWRERSKFNQVQQHTNSNRPRSVSRSGASPLSTYRVTVGWWVVAAIVALRVGVGLHFYLEGSTKLRDKKPFSAGFFANAKGPLASVYRNMVWDIDGTWRLDGKSTNAYWADYQKRIGSHFGFDEKQNKAAENIVKDYSKRLSWFLGSKREDINEYMKQLDRRDANRTNPQRQLTSLEAHDARIDADRNGLKMPMLAVIDKMWVDLESDLNSLANDKQWQRHGRLKIGKIGRRFGDSEFHDAVIPYMHITIGVLLIMGLFTRVAAIGAALFLASVCAAQWPGYGGIPIYYQLIEMLAALVLAAIGAGQFYGLDFVINGLRQMTRKNAVPAARTS